MKKDIEKIRTFEMKVRSVGNSRGGTIPPYNLEWLNIKDGDVLVLTVEEVKRRVDMGKVDMGKEDSVV